MSKIFSTMNLFLLLLFVFVANIADAFLTLTWIQMGIAEEANPIMRYVLTYGNKMFVSFKVVVVSSCIAILWLARKHKSTFCAALFCALIYLLLLGLHAYGYCQFA